MPHASSPKIDALLDASFGVFMRFGYRKTSVQDVADAAQLSRQGLYLHFPSKELLFRATVEHAMTRAYRDGVTALGGDEPLDARIVNGFDAWMGRFVGIANTDASDLLDAAHLLSGSPVFEYEARFIAAVAGHFAASPLAAYYAPLALTPAHLAETLYAVARGYKHTLITREEFLQRVALSVRTVCAPLLLS
ncbi:TetR/AcrR family transcriptional regulator [Gemmatimonas groenlandica]|uniref:TetR/AcrR family transcriptional regulator n=1 Tax=Gemmatimonas groenlandica TaxID=2732249 RepID=A0A6M4IT49_9BACT|nr:TetR/AcrR family transcriptional regulator [Gemmatimonas groenlandica]QJR36707.1 TetR/AcrR family transcriptional regulator [Gemmatimonas groenlandica]